MGLATDKIEAELKAVRDTALMARVRILHSQQNEIKMFTVEGIRHLEITFHISDDWIGYQFVQGPTVSFCGIHVSEPLITDNYATLAEMMCEIELLASD